LDNGKFHRLCNELVAGEYPAAKCIEGMGGDRGIDCHIGLLTDESLMIFQHKFLHRTLGSNGKNQIKKSLTTVLRHFPNTKKWTLLIAKDFTIGEIEWFDKLKKSYPTVELEVWNDTRLRSLLPKNARIRYDYFPLSISELKIKNDHESKIIETLSDWSTLKLWYKPPFSRCDGLKDSRSKGIDTFPFYRWSFRHLQTGYQKLLEEGNNMDLAISEYNTSVGELESKIDRKVKERFKVDFEILEASLSDDLNKHVYKNAFYVDEINPLVLKSLEQWCINGIRYPDKQMLKVNEIPRQASTFFVLSTAAPLLCSLNRSVANDDRFLTTIQNLSDERELTDKFQRTYQLHSQLEEKTNVFRNSLKDTVNEMKISSIIKGLCDTCPHKL
jgi:hypothetical protein